jgi:hypothetical protein
MVNFTNIPDRIYLSPRLKEAIINWLSDRLSLELELVDVDKIENLDELIAFMLEDDDNLLFNFRVREPAFAMGKNAQHACENYSPEIYDEDEIIFTGYWQHF